MIPLYRLGELPRMASVSLASIAVISVGCIGETVSTSTSSSPSWYAAIIFGAAAGLMAVLTLGAGRWFIRHTFVKHDLSALAYLGSDEDVTQFANAPLYPDNQRFYLVGSKLLVNNDPRDVLGFVVGKPRWLESPPNLAEPGYYAYVVINWEYSEDFKRWVKRGRLAIDAPGIYIPFVQGLDRRTQIRGPHVESLHAALLSPLNLFQDAWTTLTPREVSTNGRTAPANSHHDYQSSQATLRDVCH